MSNVFFALAVICALATLGILFAGVFSMGRGTDREAGMRSNKLMRWRIMLQGAALIFIILWWVTKT